jgi:hypothetical protein
MENIYDIISNNKINIFEKYINKILNNNEKIDINNILGYCIGYQNNIMIAILNLKIKEYDMKINRMHVLKGIYSADCHKSYEESCKYDKDIQINFKPFRMMDVNYINQYWNIFNVKK